MIISGLATIVASMNKAMRSAHFRLMTTEGYVRIDAILMFKPSRFRYQNQVLPLDTHCKGKSSP
jgi:hypothetical protein